MTAPDLFDRIRFRGNPVAHPGAVVTRGDVRFTVLTPRLLRLEWAEGGAFEDRATYAFPTRYTETPPAFTVREEGGVLTLDTGALTLRYTLSDGSFTPENLAITFMLNGESVTWRPGMLNPQNLRGTRRTLDQCAGDAALEEGILSRAGWALFDDSRNVLFNADDGWVAPIREGGLDWYFFGYGHEYKVALAEYMQFGGAIPLIPRFILGGWWSRYWAYSDQDLKDIVTEFENHDIPLDVLVIDMDWHTPVTWTGYTWNRELFPDPAGFLAWVHAKGLRVTFNLHPAQGVQAHEEMYPEFARAVGIDPETKETAAFTIGSKRFVEAYFKLLHHPMEADGVDFWWMDWQQGEVSDVKGLDPLPWLNHLHFNDITRKGVRPMLYSRWGGLGNHRYYIGFSGDTYETWESLAFQPYFTATASNVLYGWWSHDIGGHMGGTITPELYARWVQYGALSPVLRLHSTKDARCERRPWAFGDEVFRVARAAFQWRYRLIPYLYSLARKYADTGLSVCYPMYYDYPESADAYAARFQYFFGDQMLAAPIVHPADPATGMAHEDVWIPEGLWIDYQTKETFTGPRWVRLVGDLDRTPMLMRAGAILPLAPDFVGAETPALKSGTTDAQPRDGLMLAVFPGAEGRFFLYEDDGVSEAYRAGEYEWTELATAQPDAQTWVVHIAPTESCCNRPAHARRYEIRLEGSARPDRVLVDGAEAAWDYDAAALRTTLHVPARSTAQGVTVTAEAAGGIVALGQAHNRAVLAADVCRLLGDACPADPLDLDAVLALPGDAPGKADAVARLGGPFVSVIDFTTPEEAAQQLGRVIVGAPADGSPCEVTATFTHYRGPRKETYTLRSAPGVMDAPFAFDGEIVTQSWEVWVTVDWRGSTLTQAHAGLELFPAITTWRTLITPVEAHPPLAEVMQADGAVNPALLWRLRAQKPGKLFNVTEPHFLRLWKEFERELAHDQLAGYATVTVISPVERDAILEFRYTGEAKVYLNGALVQETPAPPDSIGRPAAYEGVRSEPLHLRKGENLLLVDMLSQPGYRYWFLGARFTELDGDLLLDLEYK